MKQIVSIVALIMLVISAKAQQTNTQAGNVQAENLKASLVNDNLVVTWITKSPSEANYWEVQGSVDGKNYSTIGLVLGEDPKSNNSYLFKQNNNKIKPGFVYYRVLHIESGEKAAASNSIRLSK